MDGPEHIITFFWLLHAQPSVVVKAVSSYVQSGAWFAHPEALLLTLLSSKKNRKEVCCEEGVGGGRRCEAG